LLLGKNRNRPGGALCAYAGYALAGDGGLMAGSAGEAASLAGPLPRADVGWSCAHHHLPIKGTPALAASVASPDAERRRHGQRVVNPLDIRRPPVHLRQYLAERQGDIHIRWQQGDRAKREWLIQRHGPDLGAAHISTKGAMHQDEIRFLAPFDGMTLWDILSEPDDPSVL
jgi:hypothetical protein